MRTLDILDDSIPHGTPHGYAEGCRGPACPAVISCRDVHRRYSGDWGFKRLIDAGVSLEEILEREAAERAAARQRRKAAARESASPPCTARRACTAEARGEASAAQSTSTAETRTRTGCSRPCS